MREDHALVPLGEFIVPLVGIHPNEGKEACDLCRKSFHLWKIFVVGHGLFLCHHCSALLHFMKK